MRGITNAQVRVIENAGHAVFWNDAAAYNRCLREFADILAALR